MHECVCARACVRGARIATRAGRSMERARARGTGRIVGTRAAAVRAMMVLGLRV